MPRIRAVDADWVPAKARDAALPGAVVELVAAGKAVRVVAARVLAVTDNQ